MPGSSGGAAGRSWASKMNLPDMTRPTGGRPEERASACDSCAGPFGLRCEPEEKRSVVCEHSIPIIGLPQLEYWHFTGRSLFSHSVISHQSLVTRRSARTSGITVTLVPD